MNQLIPQSRIDEACLKHCNTFEISPNPYSFEYGVKFALNEIQPLMVEFAEWIDIYYQRSLSGKWRGINVPVCDTTEQLLEEFINSKNK